MAVYDSHVLPILLRHGTRQMEWFRLGYASVASSVECYQHGFAVVIRATDGAFIFLWEVLECSRMWPNKSLETIGVGHFSFIHKVVGCWTSQVADVSACGVRPLGITMNLERFSTHRDTFDMLDLRAHFHFKSTASVGFDIGPIPRGPVSRTIFGSLQVHHPCSGHIQTHIYLQLPARYREPDLLSQIRAVLFSELGIPNDETYELHYSSASDMMSIQQRTNREGFVDEI
jgi:hypothetical protein